MYEFDRLSPAEQIARLMHRIYEHALTTTSGGNLSIRDDAGGIWISPSGVDKGTLRAADVVCVKADGTVVGRHKPSVEYPFHKAIYEARPDLRAILHAHPADLVAFSVVRRIPDTRVIPQAQQICGTVGYALYALPGSSQLGESIAAQFGAGADCVLLENHGVACAAQSLLQAYHRFETLDFCARLHVQASRLGGKVRLLNDEQLRLFEQRSNVLPEASQAASTPREQELRGQIRDIVHRAYEQHIMTSTEGTLSARLEGDAFLITPYGVDRRYLEADDIVVVRAGHREKGKWPSRAVSLHERIYQQHPEVGAIITAQPPSVMAFGVTDRPFNVRTIPESYFVLRDVPKVPFAKRNDDEALSAMIRKECPVFIIENDALLAVGANVLQAFDRLEVAEFTARSILRAIALGGVVEMSEEQIREIQKVFC